MSQFITRNNNGKKEIFDKVRKKYVVMTEEEIVRQHFIAYLHVDKSIPLGNIGIEQGLKVSKMHKRTDIVVFNKQCIPCVIVECKAPSVKISQTVFDQIARYNYALKVKFLIVSNGNTTYCCQMDYLNQTYVFIHEIPDWETLNQCIE